MGKEVHINPINDDDLEDKRNVVGENCFVEIDIALKGYGMSLGEDYTWDELSLLHSTIAYALSNHKNEHRLSNVDINEFSIPKSPFKNKEGEWVNKLYSLKDEDLLHFLTNMVMNSKSAFVELAKSGYLQDLNEDLMIEQQSLLFQIGNMYDRCILSLNNKYSKLILNIK